MEHFDFCSVAGNEEQTRQFLRFNGLLRQVAPACQNPVCQPQNIHMTWVRCNSYRQNPYSWRCPRCGRRVHERVGSILEGSHLPLTKFLCLLHYWSHGLSVKATVALTQLSEMTVILWHIRFRRECQLWLLHHPRQIGGRIGGRRLVVEIDESLVARRKNNRYIVVMASPFQGNS